jgi:hypothetical protein
MIRSNCFSNNPPNELPRAPGAILQAIEELSPEDRNGLFTLMEQRPGLSSQYVVMSRKTLDEIEQIFRESREIGSKACRAAIALAPYVEIASRYMRCGKVKHKRVEARDEIIAGLLEKGVSDDKVYEYLRLHHPELIQIKSGKGGRKRLTAKQNVLALYYRNRQGRG